MRDQMIFQQDGAPPHYGKEVRKFLDQMFHNRWIGRCGPMTWAPRSPDLSPLDFFVWGFLKNKVYKRKITNLEDLQEIIKEESKSITVEMCQNSVNSFCNRLRQCVDSDGSYIE